MTRAPRSRDVLEILMGIGQWQPFVGPTGTQLYRIPSGSGFSTYTVSPASCTCPVDQYRRREQICKHRRALTLALTIQAALNTPREETHDHPSLPHAESGDARADARPAR